MYVCMYVWMDGWVDGWMYGWMGGWMDICIYRWMCAIMVGHSNFFKLHPVDPKTPMTIGITAVILLLGKFNPESQLAVDLEESLFYILISVNGNISNPALSRSVFYHDYGRSFVLNHLYYSVVKYLLFKACHSF